MKASWWKYVLIALISAGVIACGKDNSAGNGTNIVSNPITGGVSNPTGASSISDFRNKVTNNHFKSLISSGQTFLYWDLQQTQSSNNSNCSEVWGFLQWCNYNSGSTNYSYSAFSRSAHPDGRIRHERGNASAVHSFLKSIASSNQYQAVQRGYNGAYYSSNGSSSTTAYMFSTSSGLYIIDLSFPLTANPVVFQPATGSSAEGYFYGGYLNGYSIQHPAGY